MLEDADEGGIKLWHLVKPTEEPELPKHRRGSLRDRERAKAIPEIYLTRLLSMKVRRSFIPVSLLRIDAGTCSLVCVLEKGSAFSIHFPQQYPSCTSTIPQGTTEALCQAVPPFCPQTFF